MSSQQSIQSETSSIQHHLKANNKSIPRVPEIQLAALSPDKLNAPIPPVDPIEVGKSALPPEPILNKNAASAVQGIIKVSNTKGIIKESVPQGIPAKESTDDSKTKVSVVTSAEKVKLMSSEEEATLSKKDNAKDPPKKERTVDKGGISSVEKPTTSSTDTAPVGKVVENKKKEDEVTETVRPESPDIYDMSLNDDDDDDADNDEQHIDLYNNISTTSQKGDIPDTHVDLFYDAATTQAVADEEQAAVACDNEDKETTVDQPKASNATSVNKDGETLTGTQSILKNKQHPVVNLTSPVDDLNKRPPLEEAKKTDPVPPKERPGTPLLDEPVAEKLASSASVVVQSKSPPASLKLSLVKARDEGAPPSSPGSTPEAHTPLMDEPVAFNFPPPDPAVVVDSLSGDYLRFQSHAVAASATFNMTVPSSVTAPPPSDGRFIQQQRPATVEAFESITPPSSPEHSSSASNKSGAAAVQQNQNQFEAAAQSPALNNPVAAFPFSAFNINVTGGSRSSSRSGSAGQSPGPSFNEQSPRSDFESSGTGGSIGKSSSSKSNKRKRGNVESPDSFEPLKRTQKQSYRRSGSSSSNISKSPENSGR